MRDPKENRTHSACILIEQFRQKGYDCKEFEEKDATIIVFTHEKNLRLHKEQMILPSSYAVKITVRPD